MKRLSLPRPGFGERGFRSVLILPAVACLMLGSAPTHAAVAPLAPSPNVPASIHTPSEALSPSSATPPTKQRLARLEAEAQGAPEDAGRWIRLADAWMQSARDTQDATLPLRAQSAYRRALELEPQSIDAHLGLAWVFNTAHDFAQARIWAEKTLAIDPNQPRAHCLLGDAAVEFGDYTAALDHYQAALDARPDLSTMSRAAHVLWLTGDSRKAQWMMGRAIRAGGPHAENTAWCRAQLAVMLWHDGALLPARQQADRALDEAPQNPLVLCAVARIAAASGDFPRALELYQKSVRITPTHDGLAGVHEIYRATGRTNEAETQFHRVVEFHRSAGSHAHSTSADSTPVTHSHGDGTGNAQLARFFADNDCHHRKATAEAEQAYRAFPNINHADTLAWCYYREGRFAEARKIMQRALRWRTPDARLLFHAGMIEPALSDRPAARKLLQQALSLNPRFHPTEATLAAEALASTLFAAANTKAGGTH